MARTDAWDETIANMISNPVYNDYLFYGHMLAQCKVVIDNKLPAPAGVSFQYDHYDLYINPVGIPASEEQPEGIPGFDSFPLEQRLGILKHEMLHILNGHVARKQDRDHKAFNIATDCAINQFIKPEHIPDWAIMPDNFPGENTPLKATAEQYYELIPKNDEPNSGQGTWGKGYGDSKNTGKLLDNHDSWQDSKGDSELQADLTKNMMDKAVNATQKSRGTLPSQLSEWLSLHDHKRELNWKQVLRNITGNKRVGIRRTLTRPDRRLPNAEWIKGRTKNRMFSVAVISDTSGSVSDKALLSLWGEIRFICDITQSDLFLVQVDTKAAAPEKLTKQTKVLTRKACGGTYLTPGLKALKDARINYDCVVVTTDGYLSDDDVNNFNNIGKRVIWLIEAGGKIMPNMQSGRMQAFQLKE